ncbi:fibrinogen-related molecule [Plakobranchus ocellatus]|uniref:Fibrinogen-related molecule n=1 Tax=Plakobranchus ocellatus TaxID=259542 RepID=A0AAV4B3T5_9GAST|nr:fibrinogen-related molecule [Plakobranchus ocellatus]
MKEPVLELMGVDKQTKIECEQFFYADFRTFSFDLYCSTTVSVARVALSGDVILHLCSLRISAGRNVALLQPVQITSDQATSQRINGLDFCGACQSKTQKSQFSSFTLHFFMPVNIFRIGLSNFCYGHSKKSIVDLSLALHNNYTLINAQFAMYELATDEYSIVPDPRILSPVDVIKLKKTRNSSGGLPVCGLEVFGDTACQTGHYGKECEHTCNCGEESVACHVATGICFSRCPNGRPEPGCGGSYYPFVVSCLKLSSRHHNPQSLMEILSSEALDPALEYVASFKPIRLRMAQLGDWLKEIICPSDDKIL